MKILGIETSCDETAVCVLDADGGLESPHFNVLGNAVYSQVKVHEEYGGVFPMMAKREHAANLVPMLLEALGQATIKTGGGRTDETRTEEIRALLEREPGLFEALIEHVSPLARPDIDAIAVTHGPGLEPALWVGVNFAKALSKLWDIPIVPVNHMEGHIVSVLLKEEEEFRRPVEFPALALLISGGHTELVLAKGWTDYEIVGRTKDDAVGEAFDKVARMLGLPYPGGPQISRLAEEGRASGVRPRWTLPRPMLNSNDLDFSFSGLKTAVLYLIRKQTGDPAVGKTFVLSPDTKREIAQEFEDAATDVLVGKTRKAIDRYGAKTLIIGGGVTANRHIRERMAAMAEERTDLDFHLPTPHLSTDNAVMIAIAGYVRIEKEGPKNVQDFSAKGNLKIG